MSQSFAITFSWRVNRLYWITPGNKTCSLIDLQNFQEKKLSFIICTNEFYLKEHRYYTEHKVSLRAQSISPLEFYSRKIQLFIEYFCMCQSKTIWTHCFITYITHKNRFPPVFIIEAIFLMRATSFWVGRLTANHRVAVKIMMWQLNPPPPWSWIAHFLPLNLRFLPLNLLY